MLRKAAIFSLFFLKPLARVAVWSGGIFRWSATIAAVGLFEGLKSSQWHWNTDCSERKKVLADLDCLRQPLRRDFLVFAPNMRSLGLLRNVVTQHVRCECGNWADQWVRLQRARFGPTCVSKQHLASAPRTLGRVFRGASCLLRYWASTGEHSLGRFRFDVLAV